MGLGQGKGAEEWEKWGLGVEGWGVGDRGGVGDREYSALVMSSSGTCECNS
jgi:hypothetical protein